MGWRLDVEHKRLTLKKTSCVCCAAAISQSIMGYGFSRLSVWSFMAKKLDRNFPGGPVVKKAPCNAGDVGSVLGQRAKFPHVTEELNPGAAAPESWRS